MSEEIELASKTAGEIAGAVTCVFIEQSGVTEPIHALARALTSGIDAFFYPKLYRMSQRAAAKIKASGLSRRAIEEMPPGLLRGILAGGAMENDEGMEDRWASLLANAVSAGSTHVLRTFPDLLARLEPLEATTLEHLANEAAGNFSISPEEYEFKPLQLEHTGISGVGLDNLVGLGLLRYTRRMTTTVGSISDAGITIAGATFTNLGWTFVQACRSPAAPE